MKSWILSIGRHRSYPFICFILVISAFLYTDPFTELNLRYTISFFGAITGLICVILFTRRSQLGNYFGLLATFGESIGNFLGGNIGAGLPHIIILVHMFMALLIGAKIMIMMTKSSHAH